ncbi:MAG TPA: hypothetical protein VGG94_01775 [Chthoniobacterales bacterium]
MVPSLVALCSLSLVYSVARADDGMGGGDDVQGTESLEVEVAMTRTAAASVGSSAEVSLEADDDHGTTGATLKLEIRSLPAGTYAVSVTLKSTGSAVALGSFSLSGGDAEIEFGSDDEGAPFPPNFNPFDIATVSLSDSNNVVLFTADLTRAGSAIILSRSASIQTTPGPGAPAAVGNAVLTANVMHGQTKGMVALSAHNLPAASQLMVAFNGVNAKKTKSDNAGNLTLNLGPKGKTGTIAPGVNLFDVTSLSVRDKFGNLLLSGSF